MNDLLRFLTGLLRWPAPAEQPPAAAPVPTVPTPPATAPVPIMPTPPAVAPPSNPPTRSPATTGGAAVTELDLRIRILNSFLITPHGKLADLAPLHTSALDGDPLFYGHLAVWYAGRGEVRDHKVLFVAHLLTSDFAELREAGWVLLQQLPPHMVAAALDHAKRVIGKAPRMLKSAVANYLRALESSPERFDR